jgi:hypothetical protein
LIRLNALPASQVLPIAACFRMPALSEIKARIAAAR